MWWSTTLLKHYPQTLRRLTATAGYASGYLETGRRRVQSPECQTALASKRRGTDKRPDASQQFAALVWHLTRTRCRFKAPDGIRPSLVWTMTVRFDAEEMYSSMEACVKSKGIQWTVADRTSHFGSMDEHVGIRRATNAPMSALAHLLKSGRRRLGLKAAGAQSLRRRTRAFRRSH